MLIQLIQRKVIVIIDGGIQTMKKQMIALMVLLSMKAVVITILLKQEEV